MVRGASRLAFGGSLLLHGAAVVGVCCLAGSTPARRELARVQIREQVASPPPAPPQPPPEVTAEPPPVQVEDMADEVLPFDVEAKPEPAPLPAAPPPAPVQPSLDRVVLPEQAVVSSPEEPPPPAPTAAPAPPPTERVEAEPATGNQPPPYPPTSRARREQGEVLLEVDVDEAGHVRAVTVVRSSGYPRLDRAARAAVEQWRFTPARIDGVAVTSSTEVVVEFRLDAGT